MRSVPGWLEYFMIIAKAVAVKSKDPMTQVGCVIVDSDNHIVGTGYNGMAPGTLETAELWQRPTKYDHVIHAEANALEHLISQDKNMRLFSTMYPCANCSAKISKYNIKEVYYLDEKYKNTESEAIFASAGIKIIKLTS